MTQYELYERFKYLHERPGGFVMPNPWDGLSALLCKEAGFEAVSYTHLDVYKRQPGGRSGSGSDKPSAFRRSSICGIAVDSPTSSSARASRPVSR